MRAYESILILESNLNEEQVSENFKKIEAILTKYEAKFEKKIDLGKRALGFMMDKKTDGLFFRCEFSAAPEKVKDLHFAFKLADYILHFTIFTKNKDVNPVKETQKTSV